MGALLFGLVAGSGLAWVFMELRRDGYWREFNARRRGSNPPPPGRKPAPPCGGGEITLAQWEAMRTSFIEGSVQRGNGNGAPTTLKPPIKPQPHGGRQLPNLFP
jgi:hypothetical protein